jgi:hypothetical protein
MHRMERKSERGSALLIAMIALALLLAVAFVMSFSTVAETRIDGNFQQHKRSYYAARAGLEEVRDRMRFPTSAPTPGGLSDLLPQNGPGNAGSVLYVLNPAAGETVNPADAANKYFDFELCHEYDPNAVGGQRCTAAPSTAGWELPTQNSIQAGTGQPLSYKWVRINLKTNRAAGKYCVDGGACAAATLDNRVCWNGAEEVLAPDAATSCNNLNMHQVYMLSSYASSFGARTLTRYEVANNAVRPPGALNLESQEAAPAFNNSSEGTGVRIPPTNIDGRPRDVNGNLLPPGNGCAATPAMATDSANSTTDLQGALDDLRQKIVQRANAFCNADGSGAGGNKCTPGLWWVRGTDPTDRFTQSNCNATSPNCYKNLNLSAPQLDGISATAGADLPNVVLPPQNPSAPFVGAPGNVDPLISQVQTSTLQDQISTIQQVVNDSVGQPNYFTIPGSTINGNVTYGSLTNPAIVVASDSGGLEIQNGATVTGYGILVVPNNFRIDQATFDWTGIVLVEPPSGEFRLDSNATGFINGALMLQASANGTTNVRTSDSDSSTFTISYSCDAIDLAFRSAPLKIISYSEVAY